MGVYYSASVVWGLLVEHGDGDDWPEEAYPSPRGFTWSVGGDFMNSEGVASVLRPIGAKLDVLNSSSEGFGVFCMGDIYKPSDEEYAALREFASEHGLPEHIEFFAVSSVG